MTSLLTNRYERKYVLSEALACQIRAYIQPFVRPDEYLKAFPETGYPVYSLYLDSPDLRLYRSAAVGEKNRFKLRIRYYDDRESSPMFVEIKRRIDQIIRKQRAGLQRGALDSLLAGQPILDALMLDPRTERMNLLDFQDLQRGLRACPTLVVGYEREAWLDARTNQARLTFDRNLRAARFERERGLHTDLEPVAEHARKVIFEIKYVDRVPRWIQEVIRLFGLERVSVPKYGWSVESYGEQRVARLARHPALSRFSA